MHVFNPLSTCTRHSILRIYCNLYIVIICILLYCSEIFLMFRIWAIMGIYGILTSENEMNIRNLRHSRHKMFFCILHQQRYKYGVSFLNYNPVYPRCAINLLKNAMCTSSQTFVS
jgi:hypothetical protein